MSVTIDEQAVKKTQGRRESYLVSGSIVSVLGIAFLAGGMATLSCSWEFWKASFSCGSSVFGFLSGAIGGVLLGFGLMMLLVGFALGKYVYVTK